MTNQPDDLTPQEPVLLPDEAMTPAVEAAPAAQPVAEPVHEEPVSLVDKVTRFAETQVVEPGEMVSLSDFSDSPVHEEPVIVDTPAAPPPVIHAKPRRRRPVTKQERQRRQVWKLAKWTSYITVVLGCSLLLAYLVIGTLLDVSGLGKSDNTLRVDIPEGATTADVADALDKAGLIDQGMIFRLYSRLTDADGTYQPGTFYLTANMGYSELIRNLQTVQYRETVTVTIPEGSTVEDVAQLLSSNGVCTYREFYEALETVDADSFIDPETDEQKYPFMQEIPKYTDAGYEGRIYWLEGYLFPDTYEYYVGISAKDAIDKLLDNFNTKLADLLEGIKKSGYSLDEVITLASIVQGEAADTANMPKVARVILNRVENYTEYPYLQCDSTGDYLGRLAADKDNVSAEDSPYDTYTHMGLPPGPINNPSLAAMQAVVNPSTDKKIMKCYYFANDEARNTYYAETYEEHMAICIEHNIGIHAQY